MMVICPYCKSEIQIEDKKCSGCGVQYFVNLSKRKTVIFLQELNGNLCIPIARSDKAA